MTKRHSNREQTLVRNVEGLFQKTLLNVTEKDIKVKARKFLLFIYPVGEVVALIDTSDNRNEPTSNLNIKDITFDKNLHPQEKSELIPEYNDVFATNIKKPNLKKFNDTSHHHR